MLFSLMAGLLVAAAVQLMLTNLGVALGLTVLDWSPQDPTSDDPSGEKSESEVSLPITHLVGLGVAVTVVLVLFMAALLAVEFSQIAEPRRGAIFGLILWATYWLLFAWLSSTTLSNLANSVLGTAIAGIRRLITTLRQTLQSQPAPLTDEATSGLQALAAEVAQVAELQRYLPDLLAQQRDQLIQEISDRTTLSPDEAQSVVAELDAGPAMSSGLATPSTSSSLLASLNLPNWQQLLRQVLEQVDLSDLDVASLWQQVQAFTEESADPALPEADTSGLAVIAADAADFIRQAPVWSFHPEVLTEVFDERLYDPEADPEQMRDQLASLNRPQFVEWLEARGDLAAERVTAIADHLDHIRTTVLARVEAPAPTVTELQPALEEAQDKLIAYCRYTNLDLLTPERLLAKVETVWQEEGLPEPLPNALRSQLDIATLDDILSRRQGMSPDRHHALTTTLQTAWGQEASTDDSPTALHQRLRQTLSQSLQSVDWSAVSLEDIKPELLNQLQALDLRGELDWAALSHHLQVPEAVKADLMAWLEDTTQQLSRAPRRWAQRAGRSTQAWLHYLTRQLRDYLQFQDKTALQPQQIAHDLTHIFNTVVDLLPGPSAWPDWSDLSSALDIAALQQVLAQRRDMTVSDMQSVLEAVQAAWQTLAQHLQALPTALWSEAQDLVQAELADLDSVRQQVVTQIEKTQQQLQAQAAAVKADLQQRAEATRRQVAIAAWWLFLSLLASGGGAAIAGWLAVKY
jgi:hypothetical protein